MKPAIGKLCVCNVEVYSKRDSFPEMGDCLFIYSKSLARVGQKPTFTYHNKKGETKMYIIKEDHEGNEENKTETMLLENFRVLTKDDQEYLLRTMEILLERYY